MRILYEGHHVTMSSSQRFVSRFHDHLLQPSPGEYQKSRLIVDLLPQPLVFSHWWLPIRAIADVALVLVGLGQIQGHGQAGWLQEDHLRSHC